MMTRDWSKLITITTSCLVLLIALISFVLSYHALQGVAQAHGLGGWLSYLWPLLIDFSLVVFSLCVVTAHFHGESTWRQWSLVGLSTVATCAYNYLHAPDNLIAHSVAVVPPIMLFFSFELLMMQLKNSVKRNTNVQRLTEQVSTLRQVVDNPVQVRRQQVAAMIESGNTQKAIAGELGVSLSTVRGDIKAISSNGKH